MIPLRAMASKIYVPDDGAVKIPEPRSMFPELYSPVWYVTTLKLNVPLTDSLLAWKRGSLLFGLGGAGMVGCGGGGGGGLDGFVVAMVVTRF